MQIESTIVPYIKLWSAVIERAIDDLKSSEDLIRVSAENWFQDENSSFPWICDSIGIDAGSIRKKLLN